MPVPSYWESHGYDGHGRRRMVSRDVRGAPPSAMHGDATLTMAAIDDDDITWVNGIRGRANERIQRRAFVSGSEQSALREGTNVLAVRVADGGGGGGINGDVSIAFCRRRTISSLAGAWKFKVAVVSFEPDGQQINKIPTVLYNG